MPGIAGVPRWRTSRFLYDSIGLVLKESFPPWQFGYEYSKPVLEGQRSSIQGIGALYALSYLILLPTLTDKMIELQRNELIFSK